MNWKGRVNDDHVHVGTGSVESTAKYRGYWGALVRCSPVFAELHLGLLVAVKDRVPQLGLNAGQADLHPLANQT